MCCPPTNQHGERELSPQSAAEMVGLLAIPAEQDFTERVLAAIDRRCNYEGEFSLCGAINAIKCQGSEGCLSQLCVRHFWVCPDCAKRLCSWCFDKRRHECGRAA